MIVVYEVLSLVSLLFCSYRILFCLYVYMCSCLLYVRFVCCDCDCSVFVSKL